MRPQQYPQKARGPKIPEIQDLHTRKSETELLELGMHPTYIQAYLRLPEIQKNKINMLDFTNRVDLPDDIKKVNEKLTLINDPDKSYAEGEKEALIMSDILEGLLFDQIKNANLFGENVKCLMPSVYDDIFNGTDLILEQSNDGFSSYSGLGIDITFGNEQSLKKLNITRRKVLKGKSASVKYFISPKNKI